MPDPAQLSDEVLQQLPDTFTVQVAGLSEAAQSQVIDAVRDAASAGHLDDLDTDHALADAQAADAARGTVEMLHHEQADAVSAGDYTHAQDLAQQAGYALREVEDHGGQADAQIVQADRDVANLDTARFEQATAHENAEYADHAYASGDTAHGDMAAVTASDHAVTAAEHGADADQGGHYADHSAEAAASVGAEASTE